MTLHLGLPSVHQRSAEQQQEIREAKRLLKEKVRDDWDYPPLPAFQVPVQRSAAGSEQGEERIAGFKFHTPDNYRPDARVPSRLGFEPDEWREREYSSEDGSDDESLPSAGSDGSKKSNYKFEGPDSVGTQLSDRKLMRKRKRQKALDEEVDWNNGLAHWLARRDAWCGAHTSQQIQMLEARREAVDSGAASNCSTPRSSTCSSNSNISTSAAVSSPSTTPELAPERTIINTRPPAPPSELLVPLAPPILADNPIRRRITAEIYPEIYNKIILQSRTPSVPINLSVTIRALVQGWKDDGEWPPKQGPVEKSIGRRRGGGHESTLKNSVKAVGRVLRITSGESSITASSKEKN